LAAARALDHGHWEEARELLRSAPLERSHPSQRLVAAALWKRVLLSSRPRDAQSIDPDDEALTAFDKATGPLRGEGDIWATFHALPILELKIGAADTAAIVATTRSGFSRGWRCKGRRACARRAGSGPQPIAWIG
jgi:hypothetical protein